MAANIEENATIDVNGRSIAFDRLEGEGPTVVFMGGYASARRSTKASALLAWAAKSGKAFVRFDYSGHGTSSGRFEDATIGLWLEETVAVIDRLTPQGGKAVLVGSSMGGWIALLAALERSGRVGGVVTVACGADFTEEVVRPMLPPKAWELLETKGVVYRPGENGEPPTPLTLRLLEEARNHLLLGGPIPLACPVHLIHGMRDADVPWEISLRVLKNLASSDATLELVKEGDHRLSAPDGLARLERAVEAMVKKLS